MAKKRFEVIGSKGPINRVLEAFDSVEDAEAYRKSAADSGWENTAVLDTDAGQTVGPNDASRKAREKD
jgi:hypothetical protein